MVKDNRSKNQTAFTISIEAKKVVTTGGSAKDCVTTVKTATYFDAQPEDLARPGNVFPLVAKTNGVLARRGHTEGTIDLMSLANLVPSGGLCELTNPDGTMAKLPETIEFARRHEMPVLTIEDIVEYRTVIELRNEYDRYSAFFKGDDKIIFANSLSFPAPPPFEITLRSSPEETPI